MRFLFLNWKDIYHPQAGGAEVVHQQIMARLVADGHIVTLLTSEYKHAVHKEVKEGIEIIRVGKNKYTHTFVASFFYIKNLRNKYDFVISCNNTAPYFACLFKGKEKHFAFYHQLAREVWFYETGTFLSYIGYYFLEPVSVFLQAIFNPVVITVSESTKQDLLKFGFKDENIKLISEGTEILPISNLNVVEKFKNPTILSLGSVRAMKRTLDIVKAFEFVKARIANAELIIAGDTNGKYASEVLEYISDSKYKSSIKIKGRVSKEEKKSLKQKSHLLCVTSIKEGWGLVVTEANSQGTPAVVYNVDGLRDSVKNNQTGLVTTKNVPEELSEKIIFMLENETIYKKFQENAWEFSKTINFDKSYVDISNILGIYST